MALFKTVAEGIHRKLPLCPGMAPSTYLSVVASGENIN